MSDDDVQPVDTEAIMAMVAGLQDQIDDLTATLESHQRLFERLHAAGVLTDAGDQR